MIANLFCKLGFHRPLSCGKRSDTQNGIETVWDITYACYTCNKIWQMQR